jgi:proteasome alpha subunit
MTMPMYASPEQFMRDRSEYARKGIGRGRSVVVTTYAGGVLFVAENNWRTLHKVSEIYDRIGFAAVGRYNEFENLRTAGIRLADVRGYSYDRRDVTGRWLANAFAQTLGSIFSEHQKPFEVELCVAEVATAPHAAGDAAPTESAGDAEKDALNDDADQTGAASEPAASDEPGYAATVGVASDQLYRISYDGSIVDESRYVVMGGSTEPIAASLDASFVAGWSLSDALTASVAALGAVGDDAPRELGPQQLEVAILDRFGRGRRFRRLTDDEVGSALRPAAD